MEAIRGSNVSRALNKGVISCRKYAVILYGNTSDGEACWKDVNEMMPNELDEFKWIRAVEKKLRILLFS